jgi:uncharacterized protein with GYD domain
MPTFVSLMSYTDKGIREIKTQPQRRQEINERLEELGVTVKSLHTVMGEYDQVAVWEAPDDDVAAAWLLEFGARGYMRTVTMRAFDDEQIARILDKVP